MSSAARIRRAIESVKTLREDNDWTRDEVVDLLEGLMKPHSLDIPAGGEPTERGGLEDVSNRSHLVAVAKSIAANLGDGYAVEVDNEDPANDSAFSEGEDGTWVRAWVFVPKDPDE